MGDRWEELGDVRKGSLCKWGQVWWRTFPTFLPLPLLLCQPGLFSLFYSETGYLVGLLAVLLPTIVCCVPSHFDCPK